MTFQVVPPIRTLRSQQLLLVGLIVNAIYGVGGLVFGLKQLNQTGSQPLIETISLLGVAFVSFRTVLWALAYRGLEWARLITGIIIICGMVLWGALMMAYALAVHTGQIQQANGLTIMWGMIDIGVLSWSLWVIWFSRSVSEFFRNKRHH